MVTTADLIAAVYKVVKQTDIKTALNGEVYLNGLRPLNSDKNDIVIAGLSIANGTLQPSTVLVQVFVKNIKQGTDYVPNYALLNKATKLLLPALKERYLPAEKTWIDIEYQQSYKVDNTEEWVSVIKLITRTLQN